MRRVGVVHFFLTNPTRQRGPSIAHLLNRGPSLTRRVNAQQPARVSEGPRSRVGLVLTSPARHRGPSLTRVVGVVHFFLTNPTRQRGPSIAHLLNRGPSLTRRVNAQQPARVSEGPRSCIGLVLTSPARDRGPSLMRRVGVVHFFLTNPTRQRGPSIAHLLNRGPSLTRRVNAQQPARVIEGPRSRVGLVLTSPARDRGPSLMRRVGVVHFFLTNPTRQRGPSIAHLLNRGPSLTRRVNAQQPARVSEGPRSRVGLVQIVASSLT